MVGAGMAKEAKLNRFRKEGMSEIGIGSTVWVFDINRRVYPKDEKDRGFRTPIWREHWREYEVIGETSRSWLLGYKDSGFEHARIPKKRVAFATLAYSPQELDELEWAQEHSHKIRHLLNYGGLTPAQWKAIAEIVGYKP